MRIPLTKKRFDLKIFGIIFTSVIVFINQPSPVHSVVLESKSSGNSSGSDTTVKSIRFRHAPGEILVKFNNKVTELQRNQYHAEAHAEVLSEIPELGVYRVKSKKGISTEALIHSYKNNPFVEYAEPNGIFHTTLIPNDSSFGVLWGLRNTGQTGGTVDADIDAPEAWDLQTGSSTIIVADIDTGVDYTHPDLSANIWTNSGEIPGDGLDNDGNGFIDDVRGWDFSTCARFRFNGSCQIPKQRSSNPMDNNGHGTHTSGTIAAVGNNGIGVVGVTWRARIMPVKWLNADGEGTFADGAAAILYASQMGAKVSNNSWGCEGSSGCFSQTVENAINTANQRGMLFVVAAGNGGADGIGDNNDTVTAYPCNSTMPNVVCVAATDQNDHLASFSNYGANNVDLGAPGTNILSTVPTGTCELCISSGYRYLNGTSMATPHVAGAALLLLSQNSSFSPSQLKSILMNSVDSIPALSGKTVTGGRLNAYRALQFVPNQPPSADSVSPMNSTTAVGTVQTFTAVYSDPNGWQNIAAANFYLAGGTHNEWLHYLPAPNLFTMMGTNEVCNPGQAKTLSSGFLTLDCGTSSISGSGTVLTVTYRVTPQSSSSGIQYNIFSAASDQGGAAYAIFAGTWRIQ